VLLTGVLVAIPRASELVAARVACGKFRRGGSWAPLPALGVTMLDAALRTFEAPHVLCGTSRYVPMSALLGAWRVAVQVTPPFSRSSAGERKMIRRDP